MFETGWVWVRWFCVVLIAAVFSACGSAAPLCQLDSDCAVGQICLYQRCAQLQNDTQVKPPVVPSVREGIRTMGQSCDPRSQAWFFDRCASGMVCAMLGEKAPSVSGPSSLLELDGA